MPCVSMSVCSSVTADMSNAVYLLITQQPAKLNTCKAAHASKLLDGFVPVRLGVLSNHVDV